MFKIKFYCENIAKIFKLNTNFKKNKQKFDNYKSTILLLLQKKLLIYKKYI